MHLKIEQPFLPWAAFWRSLRVIGSGQRIYMTFSLMYFFLSAGLLIAGAVLGYLVRQNLAKRQLSTAEGQAAKMVEEAEMRRKK